MTSPTPIPDAVPCAAQWTRLFARTLPVPTGVSRLGRRVREALSTFTTRDDAHLPVWAFMTAHELVDAHLYGGSTAAAVRVIDTATARLLGLTDHDHGLGVGERVEAMARFWVGRVRAHGDSRAHAALAAAVDAYDAHLETLSEMSTGDDAC